MEEENNTKASETDQGEHGEEQQQPEGKVSSFIGVLFVIIIGAACALLLLAVKKGSRKMEHCKQLGEPILISACMAQFCTFDTTQCNIECPLGFEVDDIACPISCICASSGQHEFDIEFKEENVQDLINQYSDHKTQSRLAFDMYKSSSNSINGLLWGPKINGSIQIPFKFHSEFEKQNDHVKVVMTAFEILRKYTCINFVPLQNEASFVNFIWGNGCSSMIGRQLNKPQDLKLGKGCESRGSVFHEIMHVLGFKHEHSRPDRDSFVTVHWENINKKAVSGFRKRINEKVTDLYSQYDTASVTHCASNLAATTSKPTITTLPDNGLIQIPRDISDGDIYEINLVYNCLKNNTDAMWGAWGMWSRVYKTCGTGIKSRYRKCLLNEKISAGSGCQGERQEILKETFKSCQVDNQNGTWKMWSQYGVCSRSCDRGMRWRHRMCSQQYCNGNPIGWEYCNTRNCLRNPSWGMWGSWSGCSKRCEGGLRKSLRRCMNVDGRHMTGCEGSIENFQEIPGDCNTHKCDNDHPLSSIKSFKAWKRINWNDNEIFHNIPNMLRDKDICRTGIADYLTSGDIDGDGKTDVFCQLSGNKFYISQNDGKTFTRQWNGEVEGCLTPYRFMADAHNDAKESVICIDPSKRQVAFLTHSSIGYEQTTAKDKKICRKPPDNNFEYISVFVANGLNKIQKYIFCHYGDVLNVIPLNE